MVGKAREWCFLASLSSLSHESYFETVLLLFLLIFFGFFVLKGG